MAGVEEPAAKKIKLDEKADDVKEVENKKSDENKAENKTEVKDEEEEEEGVKPKISGIPLICGSMNWDLIGREKARVSAKPRKVEPAWTPQVISALSDVRVVQLITGPCAVHSFFITDQGKLFGLGRNEQGQLGLGNTKRQDSAVEVPFFKKMNVTGASCGRSHSIIITESNGVYGVGDNMMGQLGIGSSSGKGSYFATPKPCQIDQKVKQASCGLDFTLFLTDNGSVYSAGSSECGQLGINDNGEYIDGKKSVFSAMSTPTRVHSFFSRDNRSKEVSRVANVVVKYVSAGQHHCLALSTRNELFTWGFNGYGRLGHRTTENELIPMRVMTFLGPRHQGVRIAKCSYGGCFAVDNLGNLYCWGQNQIARLECPYPIPVEDLYGWQIRDIAPGKFHHVIAADHSAIAMGKTTQGELGMGPNTKSSSRPDKMWGLDGLQTIQCAAGAGHSLLLVADDNDEAKKLIDKLDVNVD